MIVFTLEKEDEKYAEQIIELAEMSITIDEPKSFSSNLDSIIQIGVEIAPYAITSVALIIIELIKNRKKIRIKTPNYELEGDSEIVLDIAKELIAQEKEEEAKKRIEKLLEK